MDHTSKDIENLFRGSATPPSGALPGEPPYTTRPVLTGTFGMVASTHWLGTASGIAMLEKGGNAFDAGVATGLTLQIVEPHMAGPAGDAPIILCDGKTDNVKVICGQGVAPAKATAAAYRTLGLDIVPGAGLLPLVVPGAFDAFMLLPTVSTVYSISLILGYKESLKIQITIRLDKYIYSFKNFNTR